MYFSNGLIQYLKIDKNLLFMKFRFGLDFFFCSSFANLNESGGTIKFSYFDLEMLGLDTIDI